MTRSASERALRAVNRIFHVALPLILVLVLAELPRLSRWAGDRAAVGGVGVLVGVVAAVACVAALRRQAGRLARPHVLLATGTGALGATYAFAAVMVLTGGSETLEPHATVGRLAMGIMLAASAILVRASRGEPPPPPDVAARQRLTGTAAAFLGIELILAATALFGAPALADTTPLGTSPETLLRGANLAAAAFCVAAALALAAPTGAPTRRRSLLATGAMVLAVAGVVSALEGSGVQPILGELTVAAGVATCVAAIRADEDEDRSELFEGIRLLAASLSDGVLLFDPEGRLAWRNAAAARLLHVDAAAYGEHRSDVLADASDPNAAPSALGEAEIHTPAGRWTIVVARDTGGELQAREEAVRLGGRLASALQQVRDLERVVEIQQADLDRATTLDPATGAANRRTILARLRSEVIQARRYPHPVAVVLLELDVVPEEESGAAMREAALRLRLRAREADGIGRSGTKQFLLVLPHTEERGVAAIIRGIRRSIVDEPITAGGTTLRVAISTGTAVLRPGVDISVDELLARAESELAAARQSPAGAAEDDPPADAGSTR